MLSRLQAICFGVAVTAAATALAEDAYYDVPIRELHFTDGKLPAAATGRNWRRYEFMPAMRPYAVLDGAGEAYVSMSNWRGDFWMSPNDAMANGSRTSVRIRATQGKDVSGRIIVPKPDLDGMIVLRFTVPASAAKDDARKLFYDAKMKHYDNLMARDAPGTAWFRHQHRTAELKVRGFAGSEQRPSLNFNARRSDELTRTYDLFTGGRAMSENLQLDRELPQARPDQSPVKISSLDGITINEIDWAPLVKDARPKLDFLADYIPADQHAVFFQSFAAMMAAAGEIRRADMPVLRLAQPRSEDERILDRYQTQLGLAPSAIARLLGPQVVRSVALTGSDPYFAVGTDLAMLFESPQPEALENLLSVRIGFVAAGIKEAAPVAGELAGVKYRGFLSPDRTMSSYIARLGDIIVVTNSKYQLERLADVRQKRSKAISSLPEYVFFRNRYVLGDADETALLFISDAAIRRWCGPRWRIADSRRTRARAVLAELETLHVDDLVKKTVKPGPIYTDYPILGGGSLTISSGGVRSSELGSLSFMTPIAETPLEEVTRAEADSYQRWRDGYQRNWSWGFDPIAFRITLGREKLAADMTVMPLILGTQYHQMQEWTSVSLGGKFDSAAADPHDALAQLVLSINRDSPMFRQGENFAATMGQAVSLRWIGAWATVYLDDDQFWDELKKLKADELHKFMGKSISRLPVAVQIDSSNSLQLAVFLSSARVFIEQTAPGLTNWESLKYKDQAYVRITPKKGGVPNDFENMAIYYTPLGGKLTATLSEKMLQRWIDRWLDKDKPDGGKPAETKPKPWLGSTVALHVDRKILEIVNAINGDQCRRAMQMSCWSNLPILNEWKRLYPDLDPVKVHETLWGTELVCPGGGKYVWNEKYRTMESTVYGHPGEPKEGPVAAPMLGDFMDGNFGLSFENHGLRAQVELTRNKAETTKK